ncbi:TetR/AcrR family transcriptional regulator [Marinobacterium aestuariivivens]|uniref:TetR/AcrR family transcriptional regulator n=1 Tax=Marinobacterium aestuariivivens TaxID=1698799 RepID=A0ABW2A5F0_9GAMM
MNQPRQIEKRKAIINAATEMFLESGYAGVSVDGIIAQIGGSKRTIYKYFGDKDGLFAAIVEQLCEEIVTPLTHMDLKRLSLQEALSTIAHTFLEVLLSPRTIALHRLIVAEAPRAPASARTFFNAAPATSYRCLTEYFIWADGAGLVTPGDAHARAILFLDALTGDFQLRSLLGLEVPGRVEQNRLIDEAIAVFMKGIAPTGD